MTTLADRLEVADKPESIEHQLEPAWPPATPPAHGRGWPPAEPPHSNSHETGCEIKNSPPSQCSKPSTDWGSYP